MREYIMRFKQQFLLDKKISKTECFLVEYLAKFFSSGNAISKQINNQVYFWITYNKILTDLQVLNIQKRQLQRVFSNLEKKGIIQKYLDENQKIYITFIKSLWDMFDCTTCDTNDTPDNSIFSKNKSDDTPEAMGVCQKCPLIINYNKNKINIFFYNENSKNINANGLCLMFLNQIKQEISEVLFFECFGRTDVQKYTKNHVSLWVDNVEWIYKQVLLKQRVEKVIKNVVQEILK